MYKLRIKDQNGKTSIMNCKEIKMHDVYLEALTSKGYYTIFLDNIESIEYLSGSTQKVRKSKRF